MSIYYNLHAFLLCAMSFVFVSYCKFKEIAVDRTQLSHKLLF